MRDNFLPLSNSSSFSKTSSITCSAQTSNLNIHDATLKTALVIASLLFWQVHGSLCCAANDCPNYSWVKPKREATCGPICQDEFQTYDTGACHSSGFSCFQIVGATRPCSTDDTIGCTNWVLTPCENQEEEVCDDQGFDEDNDGNTDCRDSDCQNTTYCQQLCDKDNDGHQSTAFECNGDDCNDDPDDPKAPVMYGGNTENTAAKCTDEVDNDCGGPKDCVDQTCRTLEGVCNCTTEVCDDQGNADEDCDGLPNCTDDNCTTHLACEIGGGETYTSYSCYGQYLVTTYYSCNAEGCNYMYETWEYMGSYCVLNQ